MNSFKFVADGITAEVERQIGVYEAGGEVVQETLHFDPRPARIAALRSKEEAHDYRYFPEPDLVAGRAVRPRWSTRCGAEIGELPAARIRRLEAEVRASIYDADVLNERARRAATSAWRRRRPSRRRPPTCS